jgi:hypothetical protein
VRELKVMDMDPMEEIPFNFLFRDPPGKSDRLQAVVVKYAQADELSMVKPH